MRPRARRFYVLLQATAAFVVVDQGSVDRDFLSLKRLRKPP